jgi:protein SCO1
MPHTPSRTPKLILLAVIGIVAASLGALLAHSIRQDRTAAPTLKNGTVLQPPKTIPDFALIDHTGAAFTAARLHNQWTFMFFGFANCGDVCPTTLTLLAATSKALGDLPPAQRPQVVFVSVDAQRDTSDALKAYIKNFDPAFVAVTGPQTDLDAFTKSLGVPSAIRPLEHGGYAVDHYAGILAFNPQGELSALFSAPHTVDALASDYRALVGATR